MTNKLDIIAKVSEVIDREAVAYEKRTGNQLRASYLRERLGPMLQAELAPLAEDQSPPPSPPMNGYDQTPVIGVILMIGLLWGIMRTGQTKNRARL